MPVYHILPWSNAYVTMLNYAHLYMSCLYCVTKKRDYIYIKSGLRGARNCVGELALRFEMVASFYVCQPNHSYAVFIFSLHSDPTCAIVVADVLHRVWSELPHQESYLFIGLWPHCFHKIMS